MSDQQREQGRDSTVAAAGSRPEPQPVPSPAGVDATPAATATRTPAGPTPAGYPAAGAPLPGVAAPAPAFPAPAFPAPAFPAPAFPAPAYSGPAFSGPAFSGPAAAGGPNSPAAGGPVPPGAAPGGGSAFGGVPHGGPPAGGPPSGGPPPEGLPGPAAGQPRPRRPFAGIVAAALVAGLVGGGAGFAGAYALLGDPTPQPVLSSTPATSGAAATVPGSVADAAARATPSTVDIRVRLADGGAEGSGVILSADGYVLTNNHVVAGATGAITVTLADGTEHEATVVGTAPSYDLAVIKLRNTSGLTAATLGISSQLRVGQQVVAIGSPQGLSGTVTTGIISAFDRTVQVRGEDGSAVVYNGLQTDAPINPGNSGGALVNLDGQVVGINSAIATAGQGSGNIGLGFAIPIDQARRVAQEIIDTGSSTKPVLGVRGSTGGSATEGAQLSEVVADSPAAKAGLVTGDVVTKVGTAKVEDFADLIARVGAHAPGDTVELTVTSGGGTRTVQVQLGSTPDEAATTSSGGQGTPPFVPRGGN